MATEFDLMLFEQHLAEALELPVAARWSLELDTSVPLGLFATLHPRTAPQEFYKARIRWKDYSTPFSLKFINMEIGSDTDARAWPNFEGSRPQAFLACTTFTEEGQGLHPEWEQSAFNRYHPPEQPLIFALLTLQHLLDNTYQGRGHQ